eukprot:357202-Chlamydomonas_euryale.AAC.14
MLQRMCGFRPGDRGSWAWLLRVPRHANACPTLFPAKYFSGMESFDRYDVCPCICAEAKPVCGGASRRSIDPTDKSSVRCAGRALLLRRNPTGHMRSA